jgi:hypothetical protein
MNSGAVVPWIGLVITIPTFALSKKWTKFTDVFFGILKKQPLVARAKSAV